MGKITTYKNFNIPIEDKPLITILEDIKAGTYKTQISDIRTNKANGNTSKYDQLKKELLAFTPSATFNGGRKKDLLTAYSGFVHLDFDKLETDKLSRLIELIQTIPFTYACFTSPSGDGLKVFVRVDTNHEQHDIAYKQVQAFYEKQLSTIADPKCKDITRLCFVSSDTDTFINEDAQVFAITLQNEPLFAQSVEIPIDYAQLLNNAVAFTNKKETYINGNRNNYIYLFASNCNRKGIPQAETESYVLSNFQHENQSELLKSVDSGYKNHIADFAKFANSADLQSDTETDIPIEDYLKNTPLIPDEVYRALPFLLQEGARAFPDDKRKRDVFFTGAISILSGCLPKVQGVYGNERVYPHLFSFIIAPAASGKGVMKNAKRLADKLHERLVAESKTSKEKYEQEMVEFKTNLSKRKKDDPIPEKPLEPKFRLLYIPADCSQAMLMQILQDNDGKGIICETEADSMSGANKQDWGNYSHILRGAFHHEKISAARKTNRELIEVNEPQLAVCLSGTPAQVPKLIGSSEDGLFSRFLFYAFRNDIIWQDPSPKPNGIVYNDHFEALSNEVLNIIEFLNLNPTEVYLTQDQWDMLNSTFTERLRNATLYNCNDVASVVFRLGLILFRFCMIFSALRKYETSEFIKDVFCSDDDFLSALAISEVYLEHSLLMFNNLSNQEERKEFTMPNNKKQFLKALPHEFKRKVAIEIGKKFSLSERAIDEFLNNSLSTLLVKVKTGLYRKL